MRITKSESEDPRNVVFVLEGDFDIEDVAAVERRMAGRRPGDRVTLDTRGLRFLDSSALALLLRLQRVSDEDGWSVAFVPGEALLVRARRTGLDSILNLVDAEPAPGETVAPEAASDAT